MSLLRYCRTIIGRLPIKVILAAAALALSSPPVTVCAQEGPIVADKPSPAMVLDLIRQLDSDQFVEREEAMTRLAAAGAAVVKPLTEAMQGADRELITRGAHVLLKLAMSEQVDVSEAAYQSLRSMKSSTQRSAAAVARRHIGQIHQGRQKLALAQLIEKGAELKEEFVFINAQGQAEAAQTLEIGETWTGKDDDLRLLGWLYNIRYLAFKSDRVRGPWLKYAAAMESLESLSVRGGELNDQGIQQFVEGKPRLRILELKYVPVSDASLPRFQENLPNLISLKLYGTRVTTAGADQLRAQMPRLELDIRLGGFLGVGCQTHQLGCHVARVQAETAASRAGFIPGDVIISYAGEPVPDFDALTKLISSNKVKDSIRIELIRNVQTSAIIVACQNGSLKIKTKPHRLGVEFESMADDSPLRQQARVGRGAFSIGELRKGDVIFRINGREIPADQTIDDVYHSVCDEVRVAATQRAQAEVAKDAKAPKDEEARKKMIEKIVDQEVREERVLIQFARGGKLLTKDVVLGAWD